MHQEIQELLGAYALNAVDGDEARLVEEHLAECPRCRAEVAEHREVAALLTSGTGADAPEGVWDRIAADLGDVPPPVPIEVAFGRREREAPARRRGPVLAGLAAAAAVIVVALMGAVLVNQRGDLDRMEDQLAVAQQDDLGDLLAVPGTQVVDLHSEDGTTEARAVVGEDGDSVLLATGLPALDGEHTYQLWGLPEGRQSMVSLGVLGPDPGESAFHVDGGITTLAISEEPAGGSTQPSTAAVVSGSIA